MRRRTFIKWSSAVVATPGAFLLGCENRATKVTQDASSADAEASVSIQDFRFFDAEEQVTLAAIVDRMLPADEQTDAPSAIDLGVLYYIDNQLMQPEFEELGRMMHGGMRFVNAAANKFHGGSFHSRGPDIQDKILSEFQLGHVKGLRFPQARFFAQLMAFALEGYWGQPKYGGNNARAAWAWVNINPHCSHIYATCSE